MRKLKLKHILLGCIFTISAMNLSSIKTYAAVQTPITRSQAEQRALSMINLTWTYSSNNNSNIDPSNASKVALPSQFNNITTGQMVGIPYDWGGEDSIDTSSYDAPWSNFVDAINQGAYAGNVNTDAGYGYIKGTAGIDCSGFVQATFNIHDYKICTSTLFDTYFKRISLSDLKHMDILDRPGDHVLIFDRWGTLNGINGAFTYESTWDQTFGGIQGTKQYFVTMDDINDGYIPGRYINIVDDTIPSSSSPPPTVSKGMFAQIANVNSYANFRLNPSTTSTLIGTIPKGTILYMIDYNNGWYQVNYNGKIGWIWGNVVAPIPSGEYVTVFNAYQLNIRNNTSTTSQILGVLNQGQYAHVIDYSSDGKWYKISINGIQGWASSKYLNYIY